MRARKTPWPSGQDHRSALSRADVRCISVPHWGQTLTWDSSSSWASAWASPLMCPDR